MGINLKVPDQEKKRMANFALEFNVLNALAKERKFLMDEKAIELIRANGLDTNLYAMHFNPSADKWEAVLKPGAISVPVPGGNPADIKKN